MEPQSKYDPQLTPELWATVEKWFHHLADLPEQDQNRELDRLKESDPDTYTWLKTLLTEDEDTHPLFNRSAQDVLNNWEQDQGMIGLSIGSFRLKEHIGQGAMGSVFLAERNDGQFDQRVALKLMKPVIHDDTLQQFFKEERQILAALNHPNIARLYDGGFTDSGRPYFTMEYIAGLSIIEYCFNHRLPLKKRLEIFMQVCNAVSFAHRSLIAHLDLKPKNIIIDNEGTVKLLDFGVAKLLKQHSSEDEEVNLPNRFTLAYAAPEQLTSDTVSTASDIYSLGTILYEIITGAHPFDEYFDDSQQLRKVILNNPPPTLRKNGTPSGIPSQLLPGDLDAICHKALAKNIADRYDSVDVLVSDIQAYLSGYPVRAYPNTFGYVARKFASRHSKALAATSLVIALLASIIVYYTNRLARERDLAVQEATRSAEIVTLLTDVFTAADPNNSSGDTLTAIHLLDMGLVKLRNNLKNQPELLASMLVQISPIYLNLGKYEKGDSLARKAFEIQEKLFRPPHKKLATNLTTLGQAMINLGQLDSAEMFLRDAISQYNQLKMNASLEMADALIEISDVFYLKGQYPQSDSINRIAYAIHKKKLTPPNVELADDLHSIGTTLRKLGNYGEAEKYLLESLTMKQQLYKEPNLEIAFTLNHLGSLKQNKNDWRGSIPYIRRSLEQRAAILGDTHIETISSLSNLARAYSNLNLLDSAIILYEDALSRVKTVFPKGHYYVSAITQSLGQVFLKNDDLSKAEALFRESLQMHDRLMLEDDVNNAFALIGLGKTLMKKKEYLEAEPYLQEALDLRSKYLPEGHELIGVSQQAMGECLLAIKNYPTTIVLLEGAYASLQKYPDKYSDELNLILQNLAEACEKNNLPDKATHYQTLIAKR